MQALKEWAIVCKALEEGRQIIILRKGGILEYKQGFEVKHLKFLLFPTYEHQSKDHLQEDYSDKLDNILGDQLSSSNANTAKMTSYAEVSDVKEVTDRNALRLFAKYHIWSESYVNARMNYNPKKPMSIILLRIFKLDNPVYVDVKPEWAGCKSWIPVDIDINDGRPAIDDLQFGRLASEVREVLSIVA